MPPGLMQMVHVLPALPLLSYAITSRARLHAALRMQQYIRAMQVMHVCHRARAEQEGLPVQLAALQVALPLLHQRE